MAGNGVADNGAAASMTGLIADLIADLEAEHESLDDVVATVTPDAWRTPTPARGWDVRDQISHLCYFDGTAVLALEDPVSFRRHADALLHPPTAGDSEDVALGRGMDRVDLLHRWRSGGVALATSLAAAPTDLRVPWYGPPMSVASFVTARIMETWAHGIDVRDALGAPLRQSDRLRHVCHIGVRARRYAFAIHGVEDPGQPVRVEVTSPAGEIWAWGPLDATDVVRGSALDLALVVTQRRHPADTSLEVRGPTARAWMDVAQAFAGPAGPGRPPGAFPRTET